MLNQDNILVFIKKNLFLILISFCILIFFTYTIKTKLETGKQVEKSSLDMSGELYKKVDDSDHFKLRNATATIDIVNYFSLDCPYCRRSYVLEDWLLLKEKYTNINIVYRHNPLLSQPLSAEKAIITECVYGQSGDMGMFGFLDHVFSDFDIVNKNNDWIKKVANFYISSESDFEKCMSDESVKNKIQKQKNENNISGITYTPTILIFKDGIFIKKYEEISEEKLINIIKLYGK